MLHSFRVALLVVVGSASPTTWAEKAPSRTPETADTVPRLVIEMSNDDVVWDGSWLGLWSSLSEPASSITEHGPAAIPYLREALKDPKRYVAAHVLLSQMSGEAFCVSGSRYNTLHVTISAEGHTEIPDQRAAVEALWLTGQFDHQCLSATEPDSP